MADEKKGDESSSSKFLHSECVMMNLYGLKVGKADGTNLTDLIDVLDNSTTTGSCQDGEWEYV